MPSSAQRDIYNEGYEVGFARGRREENIEIVELLRQLAYLFSTNQIEKARNLVRDEYQRQVRV